MAFDIEYSTKPDINGNRYIIIVNPMHLYFKRGINISAHKQMGIIRVSVLIILSTCL